MKQLLTFLLFSLSGFFISPPAAQAQEASSVHLPKLPEGLRKNREENPKEYLIRVRDYPHKGLITWLDLSDCNLRRIPDFIKQFGKLENLNLSGNQLEEVPSWLNQMPNLKRLSLQRNDLANRKLRIKRNRTITQLDLGANELSKLLE